MRPTRATAHSERGPKLLYLSLAKYAPDARPRSARPATGLGGSAGVLERLELIELRTPEESAAIAVKTYWFRPGEGP